MRLLVLLCALGVTAGAARDRYHPEEPLTSASGSRSSDDETTAQFWTQQAADAITERERRRDNRRPARNVVMFLGDGMSVPTLTAARTLLGQREEKPGEEAQLSFEAFPSVGLSKTYCVNAQVADSACSATAYLCGVKANSGTIGVTAAVPRYNCEASLQPGVKVESIAAWALRDGRDAGVVTTTRITHASPAGVYANVANRHWESDRNVVAEGHDTERCPDIAHQLIHQFPGNQFKVILGGGRREFLPTNFIDEEGSAGVRTDGRNLIEEWRSHKQSQSLNHSYVWNRDQLIESLASPPEYLLGLFESDHLQYHLEANKTTEPTLTELTEIAIKSLSRNEKGFFLFVESGRIDHAHHDNFPHLALDETIQMSSAVARAAELLSEEDSLIVVTADHAHVMSLNGYPARGRDILGPSGNSDTHGVPYMTLSYTNGPGARIQTEGVRPNVLNDQDYRALRWQTHADVPLESETHGGDDVAVFAWGPHHDMFTGLYEQSQIPHLMAYAGCFGPGRTACSAGAAIHVPAVSVLILTVLQLLNLLR